MTEIEKVQYEQCLYDWQHISEIYRSIPLEPAEEGQWYSLEHTQDSVASYRKRDGYFQFVIGSNQSSLFEEFHSFEPMPTDDDAEWTVEKHGPNEYPVRTVFSRTFGPSPAIDRVDKLLERFGLWLENCDDRYISGAATFGSLVNTDMWLACRRIVILERWCLEINGIVNQTLNEYWGRVREEVEEQIRTEGEPVLMFRPSGRGAKRREPLSSS